MATSRGADFLAGGAFTDAFLTGVAMPTGAFFLVGVFWTSLDLAGSLSFRLEWGFSREAFFGVKLNGVGEIGEYCP